MFKLSKNALFILPLSTALASTLLFWVATPAQAACEYEGQQYQTGETVGPYICMPDGNWKQQ